MTISSHKKPFSELKETEKLAEAMRRRETAHSANRGWLDRAIRSQKFKSGIQWTEDEEYILREVQKRDPVVINKIHATIEMIMGVVAQNPVRIYPNPVEKNDQFLCDVCENLVDWVDNNQIQAEYEEEQAVEDTFTTGRGWIGIDIRVNPENPAEVELQEHSIPISEVKVDPSCRKDNLSDAGYIIWEKWIPVEDFKVRYPAFKDKVDDFMSMNPSDGSLSIEKTSYAYLGMGLLDDDTEYHSTDYYDVERNQVLVCHMEYWEYYNRIFFMDPSNAQWVEIESGEEKELKDRFPEAKTRKIPDKKVKWLHFIKDTILYDGDSPIPYKGFGIVGCFGYRNKAARNIDHYGVVSLAQDPQKISNKNWMQAINLISKQGVGVMAETDAFEDSKAAQDTWSDPDAVTFLKPNALRDGKIKEKTSISFPDANMKMEEIATEAIKQSTGVNPDLLGIKTGNEPGVVVRLRQQQGMTILSRLLKNVTEMKKELYKRKLALIMKYMPDAQIQKILGEGEGYIIKDGYIIDKKHQVAAPIRSLRDLKYNISLEDAPGNMTKQMADLAIYLDMIGKKFPVNPTTVVGKLDLSAGEKLEWIEYIQKNQEVQQKIQGMKAQLDSEKIKSEINAKQGELNLKAQEIQFKTQIESEKIKQKDREIAVKSEESDRDYMKDIFLSLANMQQKERERAMQEIGAIYNAIGTSENIGRANQENMQR